MPSTITDRLNGITTSVAVKAPCRVATTAAITLSGIQTVDGISLAAQDRVLVKNQASAVDNGIWVVNSGVWTRAPDFDGTLDAVGGTQLSVIEGTTNNSTYWRTTGSGDITIGTDSVTFERAMVNSGDLVTFTQAGTGAILRTIQEKGREWVSPEDFGAVGDANSAGSSGTNDTAAFTLLEGSHSGKVVNLNGKYYLVTTVPHANQYINGSFVVGSTTTDDQPVNMGLGRGTLAANTYIPRQHVSSTLTWASGNYNTAFGADCMNSNTTGRRNTAVGGNTLSTNTTGYYNTSIGSWAMQANTVGAQNVAVGTQCLQFNTIGINNTALGTGALAANTSGSNNVVIGNSAAPSFNGNRNVYIGAEAGLLTTAGTNDSIAIGYQAMSAQLTGTLNIAIGTASLSSNTGGGNNVAIGHQSLLNNTTGSNNLGFGVQTLSACTTGYSNTGVGSAAAGAVTTGFQNTAIGKGALAAATTGGNNTAVGMDAGKAHNFDNTSALGFDAQPTSANQVKLGNTSTTTVNLGNGLILDIAAILGSTSGTPIVKREVAGVHYITV